MKRKALVRSLAALSPGLAAWVALISVCMMRSGASANATTHAALGVSLAGMIAGSAWWDLLVQRDSRAKGTNSSPGSDEWVPRNLGGGLLVIGVPVLETCRLTNVTSAPVTLTIAVVLTVVACIIAFLPIVWQPKTKKTEGSETSNDA